MRDSTSLDTGRNQMPAYVQVAAVLRQRIVSGQWKGGDQIPTIDRLETEFDVGTATIRQAVEILRDEGLLAAQQGRGTFVLAKPKDTHWFNLANDLEALARSIKDNVIRVVDVEERATPPVLNAGEGRPAHAYARVQSVQYNKERPFAVVDLRLDLDLFGRDRRRLTRHPALPWILEADDIDIAHAYQTITIGVAGLHTSRCLNIELGSPTADCRLVLVDQEGFAIYVAEFQYTRDSFALRRDLLGDKRI